MERQAKATSLHTKSKWKIQAARNPDMSFILPLLPGCVRDSQCCLIGGSAMAIHCLCITLPHAVSLDQYGDSSPPFGEAREAISRSSEESFSIQKNTRDQQHVACGHASLVPSLHRSREGIQ